MTLMEADRMMGGYYTLAGDVLDHSIGATHVGGGLNLGRDVADGVCFGLMIAFKVGSTVRIDDVGGGIHMGDVLNHARTNGLLPRSHRRD